MKNKYDTYYIIMILIMIITIFALHLKMEQIKNICKQQTNYKIGD